MKRVCCGLAVACALVLMSDQASAQSTCDCPGTAGVGTGSVVNGPIVGIGSVSGPGVSTSAPTFPYSYYAAAPNRARGYVGLGPNDQFPFYGRAYGNPGDRWSWSSMGGGDRRYLARYYYPLLP